MVLLIMRTGLKCYLAKSKKSEYFLDQILFFILCNFDIKLKILNITQDWSQILQIKNHELDYKSKFKTISQN